MSRLSTLNAATVALPHVAYALFADFDFVSGHVRLTSFDQNFTFGGNTYQSFGAFCNFGDYPETTDLTASALTFTLSGVDSGLMSTVLTEKYHNRDAKLYIGWLDQNNALVDAPFLMWEGYMDSMQIHSDQNVSSVSLTCETRLLLMGKMAGWMYTDAHQKQFKAGDNFFNLVASLVNKVINWGAPGATVDTGVPSTQPIPSFALPYYPG